MNPAGRAIRSVGALLSSLAALTCFSTIVEAAQQERQAAKQVGRQIAIGDEDRIRIEEALPEKAAVSPAKRDVPWGTGVGRTEQFLEELHRLGIKPTMFGLEYSYDWFDSMPEIARSVDFFNTISLQLAGKEPG